jgi:NADH-quinone oxidoreductase subunit N
MNLINVILPELILVAVASGLFLLGVSSKLAARKVAAQIALLAIVLTVVIQGQVVGQGGGTLFSPSVPGMTTTSADGTVEAAPLSNYLKLLTAVVGALLLLLAWPTNREYTGSRSLDYGRDAGEFYALMLLSLAGLMLVASANDMILLFLGLELASIPTYIMVSMSRPLPAAQEAGVKYFFLGAMAAAVMLFGFSYLYGATGFTQLSQIRQSLNGTELAGSVMVEQRAEFTHWLTLALCMLIAGFSFKIAAVPLHAYVGDVYQGAATPVSAFLAFVPKAAGFVAIVKTLAAVGGADWRVPHQVVDLLWVLAVLTMTVGNTLGLLQSNVKRVLAYSSIAHSGYMLVGITALVAAGDTAGLSPVDRDGIQRQALAGVLFYLAAYGMMNAGAFGVLMLLPSREQRYDRGEGAVRASTQGLPATTAETFEDIAGIGRSRTGLALAMAVCCFSLIGLPFTVGFFGKLYLIQPALGVGTSKMNWLVVLTVVNAAIGAAYYLRIVATMFLRPEPGGAAGQPASVDDQGRPWWASPVGLSVVVSAVLTILFGAVIPATNVLSDRANEAAQVDPPAPAGPQQALVSGARHP